MSRRFEQARDIRHGSVEYSVHDCLMSAFALMFFQDPSLLAYQRRLQKVANLNNLKTIFNIEKIPGDTQLRDTLDSVDSALIEGAYTDFFRSLQRGKHLESYQVLSDQYLIVLDGSQYFSSEKSVVQAAFSKQPPKVRPAILIKFFNPSWFIRANAR